MSEILNIIGASVQDRAPSTTDTVLNLETNVPFAAEIDPNPDPFLIPESLGNDPRAKVFIWVTYQVAVTLVKNNLISFGMFGNQCQFQIVDGFANPALPLSRFVASQITSKDQQ